MADRIRHGHHGEAESEGDTEKADADLRKAGGNDRAAPGVPTVLATVRATTTNDDTKLNQPLARQSYAAFQTWFLDPTCRQPHAKKIARTKKHLTRS